MFKGVVSIVLVLLILAIALGGTTPTLAQGGDPPAADVNTLIQVADIFSGGGNSNPSHMTAYNNALYFQANGNDSAGIELWKYDPTNGASRAADIYAGLSSSGPSFLTVYNNELYFSADGNDGKGLELWKYDPISGAQRAADINPGALGSFPSHLAVYDGELYFRANGNDGAGNELWKYNPVNGAQRAEDITPGLSESFIAYLTVYDNALFFQATAGPEGAELWKYDPANGAQLVEDINGSVGSFPAYLTVFNNALYFSANGGDGAGNELWKYDTINGAQRVADIFNGGNSSPSHMAVYHGALYFSANGNDLAGIELWRYDPTNGAERVADLNSGSGASSPAHLDVYNDALYFQANANLGSGYELWKYDNSTTDSLRSSKVYDGWILESSETSSAGGSMNSTQTAFLVGDNAQDKQYRSILSFDTSTLPDNAVILQVNLKIKQQSVVGVNPFTTHGLLIVDVFKGALGGNSTLQLGDFQAAASKSTVGAIPNSPVGGWYTKTWTGGVFAYVNKTGLTQFRLRFQTDDNNDNGADFLKFFSGDTTTLSDRPLLEIKYYTP